MLIDRHTSYLHEWDNSAYLKLVHDLLQITQITGDHFTTTTETWRFMVALFLTSDEQYRSEFSSINPEDDLYEVCMSLLSGWFRKLDTK